MINGLIVLLLLLILVFFWISGIKDANITQIITKQTGVTQSTKEYFLHLADAGFAYVVSAPSLIGEPIAPQSSTKV